MGFSCAVCLTRILSILTEIYSRKSGISISQSPEWIAHHYQQLLPGLTFLDLVLLTMVHAHPSAPDNLIHRNVRRHPFIAAAIQRL
jgi:hypothetical protein